ncbi:photosynthesis system II assembly factor YCF48-domain-containing protein [Tribonema minus]|uniref:Photosynthesis system II assembly factor YCF48-domain-containing protein n=1 Tax=Tribonema minus TaxID=303371 RepID=A0A836CNS8_9STRA|nr:photosynthesis system II assembly factor YCF48-domain-containing protein [Tribonema minus]
MAPSPLVLAVSVLLASTACDAFTGAPMRVGRTCVNSGLRMVEEASLDTVESRRDFFKSSSALVGGAAAVAGLAGVTAPSAAEAAPVKVKAWEQIALPVATTLYDIAFDTADTQHGFVVGAKGTFLETRDGGKTWDPRTFGNLDAEEEINYRFEKVSFVDGEAFIIGKPPILLHTKDKGESWERVPLSPKLPGEPSNIVALGSGKAEMTTSTGAVYYTNNAGLNWKAQVKETIDATLNRISSSGVSGASYFTGSIIGTLRDKSGAYLAVSSRGNFYLTWQPGQDFWIPHNRGTSRRIQNMGFVEGDINKGVWMTLNGGVMQISKSGDSLSVATDPTFEPVDIKTGGYGIIDAAWKDAKEAWAVGGGGNLWVSMDGGKTYKYDKVADKIPGNLYTIKFFSPESGFVLGSDGVLLRYLAGATA